MHLEIYDKIYPKNIRLKGHSLHYLRTAQSLNIANDPLMDDNKREFAPLNEAGVGD